MLLNVADGRFAKHIKMSYGHQLDQGRAHSPVNILAPGGFAPEDNIAKCQAWNKHRTYPLSYSAVTQVYVVIQDYDNNQVGGKINVQDMQIFFA
jgi:hypothetical protein